MQPVRWRAMNRLRQAAKRSKWLVCAANVVDDQRARLAARNGAAASTSGSTHAALDLDESLGYIDRVFTDYVSYGGLSPESLRGARVLELGPGDNLGVALRFLACGAERVVAVDKFASVRNPSQQRRIYEALIDRLDAEERERVRSVVDLERLRFDPDRIRLVEGLAVEETSARFGGESFDLIVSRAVLEHLYDLDAAFASMDAMMSAGGTMLHKVDFRDHGMFTDGGMHPLTFLTIPDRLYALMSRHSGRPNRHLADWYRRALTSFGYDSRMFVTHVVGADEELLPHEEPWAPLRGRDDGALASVEAIRPRLLERYRRLDDADLATSGVFIVARKRGG